MSATEEAKFQRFSVASLIGGMLGTIWWFVWQAIKGISIGILLLLYRG